MFHKQSLASISMHNLSRSGTERKLLLFLQLALDILGDCDRPWVNWMDRE
jgi:hypothetical protein